MFNDEAPIYTRKCPMWAGTEKEHTFRTASIRRIYCTPQHQKLAKTYRGRERNHAAKGEEVRNLHLFEVASWFSRDGKKPETYEVWVNVGGKMEWRTFADPEGLDLHSHNRTPKKRGKRWHLPQVPSETAEKIRVDRFEDFDPGNLRELGM